MYTLAALTIVFAFIIYKVVKKLFSPYRNLPSPPEWPLLGHNPYFGKGKDTISFLQEMTKKYKDEGLFRLNTFAADNECFVVLVNPEYQKTVLTRTDKFRRNRFFERFFPLTGKGILTSVGEAHNFQKRLLLKPFSLAQMKYYVPVFDKHTLVLVKLWQQLVKDSKNDEGVNIDIKTYFSHMTFDIIGEIGFGYQFNSQTSEPSQFLKSFKKQGEGLSNSFVKGLLMFFPFLRYLSFGPGRSIQEGIKSSKELLRTVLQARKDKILEGSLSETEEKDLLSMMLKEKDVKTGNGLTDQLIQDNCYTFFVAGHETTATSLPGTLYYMAQYPEMQERCRQEVNGLLSKDEDLTADHLNSLRYTLAFIKESIRLYLAVPINGRTSNVEVTFGKYSFPKNTQFMCPVAASNVCEDSFDKPMEFIPERYLEGNGVKAGTSFSFGYGPNACIGKHFAMHEMQVSVVRLLQNFRFSIDPENVYFCRRVAATLKTIPEINIRVHSI